MSRARELQQSRRPEAAPVETGVAEMPGAKPVHVMVCGARGTGKTTLIGALGNGAGDAGASGAQSGTPVHEAVPSHSTPRVRFNLADTGWEEVGAEQMMAGASACNLALLLTDSQRGLDARTRRSACLLSLLGIGKVVLVVNKMDLAGFSQQRFDQISREFTDFATRLGVAGAVAVPVAASTGDNLSARAASMDWYRGPILAECLDAAARTPGAAESPFRMGVQEIVEPEVAKTACKGTVAGGLLRAGDAVVVLPSARMTRVERITANDESVQEAHTGDAVAVTLADEIDLAVGDMLASPVARAEVSDQVAAHVVWIADKPMLPGRSYFLRSGGQSVVATVTALKHKINVDNLDHIAGPTLERDEIGYCNLSFNRPLVFDRCRDNRETGCFIVCDRLTGAKVGAGMIEFGLRRATNIHWQALDINKTARAGQKGQRPCVLWFTGLSGAGKSTIANLLERRLHARGQHTYLLDGDNVRHGLNKDLGFTDADRVENIRRVAEAARLMVDAGLIVMASFISPFRSERRMARELFDDGEFIEVFVDTPLDICERRDPKGLYQKARAGQIKNFTGIDSAYEPPELAEIRLEAGSSDPEQLVDELVALLEARGAI